MAARRQGGKSRDFRNHKQATYKHKQTQTLNLLTRCRRSQQTNERKCLTFPYPASRYRFSPRRTSHRPTRRLTTPSLGSRRVGLRTHHCHCYRSRSPLRQGQAGSHQEGASASSDVQLLSFLLILRVCVFACLRVRLLARRPMVSSSFRSRTPPARSNVGPST